MKNKITDTLQFSFDKGKNPHLDKLEFLKSLWINKDFAEKCALMFTQIWATTEEILNQEKNILKVNSSLEENLLNLDIKRQRMQRTNMTKYAN